ncbi:MAG TPA: C-GCAxxG-C-C family protein [Dissulfurispiraceae bacterium]|nr:C-GCAxxG-C-C family protein [Dissulfurispiraceae bacterium]
MKDERKFEEQISRRGLIKTAIGMGSLAVITSGGLGLLSNAEAAKNKSQKFPWPYKKLSDQEIKQAGETAYNNWFKGFCAYAALSGIVQTLAAKVGGPYKTFPMEAIMFAHGGTAGWGGTCGTLIGAGIGASLVAGHKDAEEIINEVMYYYSDTALPTFVPANPIAYKDLKATSTANSTLCHISVGKWMKAEGIAEGKGPEGVGFLSHQQIDRCARMAANMSMKTLEFLNQWKDGKFEAKNEAPSVANHIPSQNNCTDCHHDNVPTPGPFGTGVGILKGRYGIGL